MCSQPAEYHLAAEWPSVAERIMADYKQIIIVNIMKLRFEVDQAEAFRRGIDVPKSIVTIEVIPADRAQEQRNLIADRLDGIDVCQIAGILDGIAKDRNGKPFRIVAKLPTFESLMEAIAEDEQIAELSRKKKRDEFESAKLAKESADALRVKFLGKPSA